MRADDFLDEEISAEDFLSASGAGAGRGNVNPALIRPRRSVGRHMYVAPDNPDNPIVPTGGSVLQDVQMTPPTFDEYRRGTSTVDAIIANSPMSAPRGPRPERDAKGVARDVLSIAGNTGVQAVKPFVDVANIPMLGALDPVSRFFGRLGRSYTDAASPTTRYDAETLARMPEGATLEKLAQIVSNPGLALNMGAPSVGSLFMPLAAVKAAGLAMPKIAAALGDTFSTGAAVTGNALMNAGDTFSQTQGDIGSRLAAALGSGAASALVGRATGGGLEGQLARRGGMPTPGGILKSVGKESAQEGGENSSNQLAQDTGEGKPLNFAKAIDEGTIGAILAPLVAGPVNLAQYAGSPERRNANLLARAIEEDAGNMPTPSAGIDNSIRFGPVATPSPATAPRVPAPPMPRLPYDPGVQNPQTPIIADTQGKARLMSADEFLDADTARAADESIGLTPDVRRATAQRQATPEPTPQAAPSDLVERLRAAGWTPPSEGNNPNPDPAEVQGIGSDLERLYQADIKDGIKQRLGIDQQQAAEPVQNKPASYADSPFLREIAARSSVNMDERSDTNVDANRQTKSGRVMPNPHNIAGKPLFRPDGLRGDALVESLVSHGYITQKQVDEADAGGVGGSTELAYDMIRREIAQPGSVKPINMQDEVNAQASQQRVSAELDTKARAIGLDTTGLDDAQVNAALKRIERRRQRAQTRMDVSREARAEREAIDDVASNPSFDDNDIPWDNVQSNLSEAQAMRLLGFSEQEIADATANRSQGQGQTGEPVRQAAPNEPAGPQGPTPANARGQGGQQDTGQAEGLTSYTADELRQRDQRIAEQARIDERQKAEEETRAKADSQRGEFALTGSDRPADVAAAGGQEGLFSVEKAAVSQRRAKPPEVADIVDLRKRESVLKSLRKCLA